MFANMFCIDCSDTVDLTYTLPSADITPLYTKSPCAFSCTSISNSEPLTYSAKLQSVSLQVHCARNDTLMKVYVAGAAGAIHWEGNGERNQTTAQRANRG